MRTRIADSWALWSVLVAQAVLTIPWLWRTAPFTDEALYLEAGHAELAHWTQHAPVLHYASFFSGAPVIYPPMAAVADSAGGLAAARALSLVCMLATTALIYLIGDRLFGRLAAVLAALLFGVCGLGVHFGALATFDPMALFLLVLAAWAAVRIRDGSPAWLLACAVALVAANATKYATLAWDPVIFGTIILYSWSKGRAQAVGLAASVALTVAVLDTGLLLLAGPDYSTGLVATTVFRSINAGAPTSPTSVLLHAFALTGVLVAAAVVGVIVSVAKKMPGSATLFLCLLVLAALIAPINQARIHELSSLDKNMGFGLPFAAVGAGYALSGGRKWLARRSSWGYLAATVTAVALVFTVVLSGRMQTVQFRGPARTTAYEAVADRVVTAIGQSYHPDTYVLVDRVAITELYYLPNIPPESWIVSAVHGKPQQEELTGLICSGDISVVVLREEGGKFDQSYDTNIAQLLGGLKRYELKVTVPHGSERTMIWKLDGPGRPLEGCK